MIPSSPRLSLIIPTLNEAALLPGLLDALQSQTRPPDEIIVADAGSTDDTASLAKAHGAQIVPGGKPGPGRNAGARQAKGDIFLFLDADVLPPSNFIELTLDEFERNHYVVATCLVDALSDDIGDAIIMDATNLYIQTILPISPRAPGFCIFARRSVHEAIGGFDEALKMSEDHDYVRRAAQYGKFGLLTSARIPVSMRRLEKEGLAGLALKYLWCEMCALAGKPIHSMPFDYEFGVHQTAIEPKTHRLLDTAKLRTQMGHFENPIQSLSASALKHLEQLTQSDWLNAPLEQRRLQIEAPDAAILYRYLVQRLKLITPHSKLPNGWPRFKEPHRESIRLWETRLLKLPAKLIARKPDD